MAKKVTKPAAKKPAKKAPFQMAVEHCEGLELTDNDKLKLAHHLLAEVLEDPQVEDDEEIDEEEEEEEEDEDE